MKPSELITKIENNEFDSELKKLYVSEITIGETKFLIGKYTYFLSEQSEHDYEVRKLSNTNILLAIAIIIKYDIIKMGTKCKINIQLNQKEYALVHYEMECIWHMGIMVDIVGAKRENLYLLPMVGNEQISLDF